MTEVPHAAADRDDDDRPTDPYAGATEIVARPGGYYRKARFIMAALSVAGGLWFAYDGWVRWPRENAEYYRAVAEGRKPEYKERSAWDLRLQRLIAIGLPLFGAGVLAWTFYRSRGQYRLADDVLEVPGHPPVPLASITAVDDSKWKRKGILYVEYQLPGGGAGRLTLDDFVYDQDPTDAIGKRVLAQMGITDDEGRSDGASDENAQVDAETHEGNRPE